jgi:hypothetical protein
MSFRFDATMKDLAQQDPQAFVRQFDDQVTPPLKVLNVDLSRVIYLRGRRSSSPTGCRRSGTPT